MLFPTRLRVKGRVTLSLERVMTIGGGTYALEVELAVQPQEVVSVAAKRKI